MKVYFIRHGESEYNAKKTYQPADAKLSKLGLEQAAFLARRFELIPIDVILASPMERARHTAEIIQKAKHRELEIVDSLKERKRPSEVVGLQGDDPRAQQVYEVMRDHEDDSAWRYSDEETFSDFLNRARDVLRFLAERKEENILCVTHSNTLRLIISLMFNPETDLKMYLRASDFFRIQNTGITVCDDEPGWWRLITWNDHAHLG